jgi:hypothetical protein
MQWLVWWMVMMSFWYLQTVSAVTEDDLRKLARTLRDSGTKKASVQQGKKNPRCGPCCHVACCDLLCSYACTPHVRTQLPSQRLRAGS